MLVSLGTLFLPVFATCYVNEPECRRASYIQQGGTVIGYALLGGMAILGAAVALTEMGLPLNIRAEQKRKLLWLAVVASGVTVVLGAWSIGFAFAPGGILLLIAALKARKAHSDNKNQALRI